MLYQSKNRLGESMRRLKLLSMLLLLLLPLLATAAPQVKVVGLFAGKAVLQIDGRRKVLAVGESHGGVKLVSADSRGAVVEMNGRRHAVALSRSVGGAYKARDSIEVRVERNAAGMFTTSGTINGVPTNFLVDTGASSVAMGIADARRFGIDYAQGTPIQVQTASGVARGYQVWVNEVTVGPIQLRSVNAMVVEGGPHTPLLGMTFLGQLKLRNEGAALVLEQFQ